MNKLPKNKPWIIYALVDPLTQDVRYVGWTIDLKARFSKHLSEARSSSIRNHRLNWLRSLLSKNKLPSIRELERGSGPNWARTEVKWIKKLKQDGCHLTNGTLGGEGTIGRKHTSSAKKKIGDASKGRKFSAEARRKISKAHKGKKRNKTWKRRIKLALKGRTFSAETTKRMQQAAQKRCKRRESLEHLKRIAVLGSNKRWNK